MNPAELDSLLQQSLADHKLSGSEKQALQGFVQKQVTTDAHRGTARSRAFAVARLAATVGEGRFVDLRFAAEALVDGLGSLPTAPQLPLASIIAGGDADFSAEHLVQALHAGPDVHHRHTQLGRTPGERMIRPRHRELVEDRRPTLLVRVPLDPGKNLRMPFKRLLEVEHQGDTTRFAAHGFVSRIRYFF